MFVKVLHYHFFQRVKGLDTKVVVGKHLTKYEVNRVVNLVILFFFLPRSNTITRRNKEMTGKKEKF